MTTKLPGDTAGAGAALAKERRDYAIVLAAGRAARFGTAKQLAPYRDTRLVTRAARLAESVCGARSVLVAGHEWRPVVAACRPLQGFFVNNTAYANGLGTSIAAGVRAVMHVADSVLLLLCDQPLIPRAHLERLVAVAAESPGRIVASGFAGTRGPPIVFPRRYFAELGELCGDNGARAILERAGSEVIVVTCEEAAIDIDRPEDLGRLRTS